ncbi:MAG: FIG005453: Putative DeoR-family transcriptional regulator, partial [uncultured Frankineae bacterium]
VRQEDRAAAQPGDLPARHPALPGGAGDPRSGARLRAGHRGVLPPHVRARQGGAARARHPARDRHEQRRPRRRARLPHRAARLRAARHRPRAGRGGGARPGRSAVAVRAAGRRHRSCPAQAAGRRGGAGHRTGCPGAARRGERAVLRGLPGRGARRARGELLLPHLGHVGAGRPARRAVGGRVLARPVVPRRARHRPRRRAGVPPVAHRRDRPGGRTGGGRRAARRGRPAGVGRPDGGGGAADDRTGGAAPGSGLGAAPGGGRQRRRPRPTGVDGRRRRLRRSRALRRPGDRLRRGRRRAVAAGGPRRGRAPAAGAGVV